MVGNDFMPRPALAQAASARLPMPVTIVQAEEARPVTYNSIARPVNPARKLLEMAHRYSLGVFALLFLIVGASGIEVAKAYLAADVITLPVKKTGVISKVVGGPNAVVATGQLNDTLQKISSQPISLTIADKAVTVKADTIRSWLKAVNDKKTGASYIHVDKAAVVKSLNEAATPSLKAALNQVTATHADGTSQVIAAGKNGTKLGDINPAVEEITKGLLAAKGFQLTLPTETLAFAAVTPDAFDKMIEIDVNTKQMWLYEKGQVVKSYPISAGKPSTPTVIGQYKIFSKRSIQDMSGYDSSSGKKYFQPRVKWINYFADGGFAVHGNYWKPASTFGNQNTSQGCVSLPESQAKEVYDWAPIGTTVITHV